MILRIRLPLIALALALPAPVLAQSAQDFQLPPAPSPSATPQVEGPVDEEAGPVPVRPRVIPAARPTQRPTVTLPSPTPAATAAATRAPATQPSRRPATDAQAQPRTAASADAPPFAPRETPPLGPTVQPGIVPSSAPLPAPEIATSPVALEPADQDGGLWQWLLGLGLLAALAALGAGGFALWRRRQASSSPPAIEPPLVRASGALPTGPLMQALSLRAEAVKLTRSFAYATLDYRLTLINRTDHAMSDLAVAADLVSANGQDPMEQQVALPGTVLPVRHALARLSPGQSQQFQGQVRLPIGEARVIRQGRLPLFVPLLRVRIDGAGEAPLARTFVIGQGVPDGGRLQPFRLDEGPRSYQPIAQRALD